MHGTFEILAAIRSPPLCGYLLMTVRVSKSVSVVQAHRIRLLSPWITHIKMRVRSWLRMNAGGVLNTCKSNEALVNDFFGLISLVT